MSGLQGEPAANNRSAVPAVDFQKEQPFSGSGSHLQEPQPSRRVERAATFASRKAIV